MIASPSLSAQALGWGMRYRRDPSLGNEASMLNAQRAAAMSAERVCTPVSATGRGAGREVVMDCRLVTPAASIAAPPQP